MENLSLVRKSNNDSDVNELIKALDHELWSIYTDRQAFFDQHNLLPSDTNVIVAYLNNEPIGCGAFRKIDGKAVEIKRMFVHEKARGKGIGIQILKALEYWAFEKKYQYTRLETGDKQLAAIALYQKSGYRTIPNYPPYENSPESICMEKLLVKA